MLILKLIVRLIGICLVVCGVYVWIIHYGVPHEITHAWEQMICFLRNGSTKRFAEVGLAVLAVVFGFMLFVWRWKKRA